MMILTINERDLRVGMAKFLAKREPAKPCAQYHDSRIRLLHLFPFADFVFLFLEFRAQIVAISRELFLQRFMRFEVALLARFH